MAINVFEGARRIAILVAVTWAIGVSAYLWFEEARVPITYTVDWPDELPVRSTDGEPSKRCGDDDAVETEYRTTARGTRVSVTICFRAQKSKDGRMLVPYRVDREKKQWLGAGSYSSEVSDYKRKVGNNFSISRTDEEWADKQYWPTRRKQIGEAAIWLVGGWVAVWLFTLVVGWIVRGFAGIPMGKDRRPE